MVEEEADAEGGEDEVGGIDGDGAEAEGETGEEAAAEGSTGDFDIDGADGCGGAEAEEDSFPEHPEGHGCTVSARERGCQMGMTKPEIRMPNE